MKTPIITSEKITQAIEDGKVVWQVHNLYNRMGLITEDVKGASCLVSEGIISLDKLEEK